MPDPTGADEFAFGLGDLQHAGATVDEVFDALRVHADESWRVGLATFDCDDDGRPCEALGLQKALPGLLDGLGGAGGDVSVWKIGRAPRDGLGCR